MRRRTHASGWQLDLFMLLMIILMITLMQARLPARWETGAEIAWCALAILGMGMWARENRAAPQREQRRTSRR